MKISRILREMEDLKKKSEGEDITVLYLSGMPGCGKTELARQIGDKFYKENKGSGPTLVGTLDAKSLETLCRSYGELGRSVGCDTTEIILSDLQKCRKTSFIEKPYHGESPPISQLADNC